MENKKIDNLLHEICEICDLYVEIGPKDTIIVGNGFDNTTYSNKKEALISFLDTFKIANDGDYDGIVEGIENKKGKYVEEIRFIESLAKVM